MKRSGSFAKRAGVALLLLLLLWTASQLASGVPLVVALGTSVHTLGLGDYSADPLTTLAPLSPGILNEVRADAGNPSAGTSVPSSTPTASPVTALRPTATPIPGSTPTPTPTSLPLPTPTPTSLPLPTPTPTS